MECHDLVKYLSDYIESDLDEELIGEAQAHLATCHDCRVVLDSTQQMIFLFREQGKRSIPAQRRQKLFNQLQNIFLEKDNSSQ